MADLHEAIEAAFTYHAPLPGQPERYTALRNAAKALAHGIDAACPASREKVIALDKLRECVMWSNASIAVNEVADEVESQ